MTRRRWIYAEGEAHEVTREYSDPRSTSWQVMPDIQPFKSMIDGSTISSRSQKNAHYRAHGYVEVGNDSSLYRKPEPIKPPPGLKDVVIRTYNDFEEQQRRKKCR